jgi:hypothetical protein
MRQYPNFTRNSCLRSKRASCLNFGDQRECLCRGSTTFVTERKVFGAKKLHAIPTHSICSQFVVDIAYKKVALPAWFFGTDRCQTPLFQMKLRDAPKQRRNIQAALEVILRRSLQVEGRGGSMKLKSWSMSGGGGMRSLRTGLRQLYGILLHKWLRGWQVHILRCSVQHSERLVFHACSETNSSDQSSMVVFSPSRRTLGSSLPKMAYNRAGKHAALGHLNSLSNTV